VKVALIVPGGVGRTPPRRVIPALMGLVQRLARQCEVHVFALHQEPHPSRYQVGGASIHTMGHRHAGWRALAAIVREHRRGAFDLLHAFWAAGPGRVAVCAGWLLRRPVLVHVTGGELIALDDIEYGGQRTVRGRLNVKLALSGATQITVPSTPMQEAAVRLGYRTIRLPLGVDRATWPVRPPRPRDVSRPARLLHVASLNRVKDQETLLRAGAVLAKQGIPFAMDIVGADTLNGEIERLAVSLGVSNCVTFHGVLPREQLRLLFEGADLLVMSSRHEADPVVVLEAAIAGVPTVGTAVGHILEWTPHAAVAVPVRDYEALARETAALLAEDARRVGIAAAAQARAIEQDADWTSREVSRLYEHLTCARA
jgi:glycosyltransferase involved in cell wall biosynthesis